MKYAHHKYTYNPNMGYPKHDWSLIGEFGGLNFHATIVKGEASCGLEIHKFFGQGAPSHTPCWLLGAPCWHDGTSMYAMDTLWLMIEPYLKSGEHDTIFKLLEVEATRFLERKGEE
jgi:hypothetical protein